MPAPAEAQRYAAATVESAWRDQLSALGVTEWCAGDRPHLLQWAESDGVRWSDAVRHAVALLTLLDRLPRLPRLCAPPGEAVAGSRRPGGIPATVLHKVRALLAKAESTTFPDEAEALTTKAHQLMARHAIDAALLADSGDASGRVEVVGRRVPIDDPYFMPKSLLLEEVASAHRCRSVGSSGLAFATVFGHEVDVAAVEVLFTSLLVQATAAMTAAGTQVDHRGRSRTRSFRQSFLAAYAGRIGERLREATDHAVAEAGMAAPGLLPVLAARTEAVEDAMAAAYPDVGAKRLRVTNGAGWAAGVLAADLADLGAHTELVPAHSCVDADLVS